MHYKGLGQKMILDQLGVFTHPPYRKANIMWLKKLYYKTMVVQNQ